MQDEGAVDLLVIKKGKGRNDGRWAMLRALLKIEGGKHIALPFVDCYKIRGMEFQPKVMAMVVVVMVVACDEDNVGGDVLGGGRDGGGGGRDNGDSNNDFDIASVPPATH